LNFRFADFEIDLARQELRRAGAIVHVEPQVFDLLMHLIRNRDRIVSKDELFEAVWQGRIVSEATLSSRISAARRALGDSGNDQSFIRTLHKRGFRFVGDVEGDSSVAVANAIETGVITLEGPVHETGKLVPGPESLPVSDQASVATLSFVHVSRDADQGYLAHGLAAAVATRPVVADRVSGAADEVPMLQAELDAAPAAETKAAASNGPRATRTLLITVAALVVASLTTAAAWWLLVVTIHAARQRPRCCGKRGSVLGRAAQGGGSIHRSPSVRQSQRRFQAGLLSRRNYRQSHQRSCARTPRDLHRLP